MQGNGGLLDTFTPAKWYGLTSLDATTGRCGLTLETPDGVKHRFAVDIDLVRGVYESFLQYQGIRMHEASVVYVGGTRGFQSQRLSDSPSADGSPQRGQNV